MDVENRLGDKSVDLSNRISSTDHMDGSPWCTLPVGDNMLYDARAAEIAFIAYTNVTPHLLKTAAEFCLRETKPCHMTYHVITYSLLDYYRDIQSWVMFLSLLHKGI